jgi:predicted GH43/DUF377 family glycosyl hydrolase
MLPPTAVKPVSVIKPQSTGPIQPAKIATSNPLITPNSVKIIQPVLPIINPKLNLFDDTPSQINKTGSDMYSLSDVRIIDVESNNPLNYNACIINDRLFFRSVRIAGEDDIMTCLMNNFKYIQNTTRIVSLKSSYKNNKHVEDPRVILHKNNYFICYTDGYNVGIAKLDLHCNTIYSHYLKKPDEVNFEGGDGREKNWLPISNGDTIDFWYGDNPRTFLTYIDTGAELKFHSYLKTSQRVKSTFGNIRGGCAPIEYDKDTKIWFFHTLYEKKYRIGAYLTRGNDIIKITPRPILTGNHIVFPCGAIQYNGYFYISMGVQDKDIGILKVSRELDFVDV